MFALDITVYMMLGVCARLVLYLAFGVRLCRTCVSELRASAPVCCTRREFSYDVSSVYGRKVVVSYHSQLNTHIFEWSHTEQHSHGNSECLKYTTVFIKNIKTSKSKYKTVMKTS